MKKVLSLIAVMFLVGTMNAQAQEKKFSVLTLRICLIRVMTQVIMTMNICPTDVTNGRV